MHRSSIVLICATVFTIFLVSMTMVSDLFIRSQSIPGADPQAWDDIGTFAIIALALIIFFEWIRGD